MVLIPSKKAWKFAYKIFNRCWIQKLREASCRTIASCRKLQFKMAAENTSFTHNSTKIVIIVMVLISIKQAWKFAYEVFNRCSIQKLQKASCRTIASCRKLQFKRAAKHTIFTHSSTKFVIIVMVLISISSDKSMKICI